MVGRRALVAVLATAAAVLGTSQASGVETVIPAEPGARPQATAAAATPPSVGTTVRASVAADGSEAPGGVQDALISGNGRWEVFSATDVLDPASPAAQPGQSAIFVRDLTTNTTRQISQGVPPTDLPASGPVTESGAVPDGDSTEPSISSDGRYVSFLTTATNIAPAVGSPQETLIVCDRDATGVQDDTGAAVLDSTPLVCTAVDSSQTSDPDELAGQPRLSGDGTTLAWERSFPDTGRSKVFYATRSSQQPLTFGAPRDVDPGNTLFQAYDPVPDGYGLYLAYGARTTDDVGELLLTSVISNNATRVDVDPKGGFLGDNGADTASGFVTFGSISVAGSFADKIAFIRNWVDLTPEFAAPRAAPPDPLPSVRAYVVRDLFSTPTAQLVSLDNTGDVAVPPSAVALSGDGHYVAFATNGANASDGADAIGKTQVVVRDLAADAGPTRNLGALATPAINCPAPPAAPKAGCGSDGTTITDLSLDSAGARVSYVSTATNLVTGDGNGKPDAFVRTWQPSVVPTSTDFGAVQTGANKTLDVPVQVTGFGPLVVDQVALTGPDAGQFSIVGDNCQGAAIHSGDSCTLSVRLSPTSNGHKQASLSVTTGQLAGAQAAGTLTATASTNGPRNAPATTVRTSLDARGGQSTEGGFESMISGNGRWDVFVSNTDLLGRKAAKGDSDRSNVYVRDLSDPQNTVQISLHSVFGAAVTDPTRPARTDAAHPSGTNPDGQSYWPSISSDGRFVSFVTDASDVVPVRKGGGNDPTTTSFTTLAVCDRDPDGDGRFDELQPGTKLPDYRCFAVESGSFFDGGANLDLGSRPMLSGDGSRITWVESVDLATDSERVRYADLPRTAGGALRTPTNFRYLRSSVAGFEHGAARNDDSNVEQTLPVLNEDGTKLVYYAVQHPIEGPAGFAVIEADLAAGTDQRVDGLGDDNSADGVELEHQPAVSDDGARVAYDYYNPDAGAFQVYVSTIRDGAVTRQLESRNNDDTPANGSQPALSGDGRYLAFVTQAADMSNGVDPPVNTSSTAGCFDGPTETDFGVVCQVVARDLVRDQQRAQAEVGRLPSELVSTARPGTSCPNVPTAGRLCGGDASSSNPSIDNTGSEIGFDSDADDLVAGDTNNTAGSSEFAAASEPVFINFIGDTFVHTWRPTLTAQPVDFGAVRLGGKKDKSVRTGVEVLAAGAESFGPVSLGKAGITGSDAGDFKLLASTCDNKTLHQGPPDGQPLTANPETCTVKIRFKPTAPGTRTAALQLPIGKNSYPRIIRDPQSQAIRQQFDPAALRTLTGVGALPVSTVNPSTVDFGTPLPQDPTSKTVTITNTGSAPLTITGGSVTDTTVPGAKDDYTVDISDCSAPLPPRASCAIVVTFTGSRVGGRNAVLVLTDNTLTGSTSIGLTARIKKPTVESNPAVSPVRRVIAVTGKGFAPNHDVEIGFDGQPQMAVHAKANGRFVGYMVVLPNGPQGPRQLFGHSVGFSKTIAGDFPFLVALGSTDPGLGVVLRD